MKLLRLSSLFFVIAASVLVATNGVAEESKPALHWYRLEIQTGDTTYQCIGSSSLEEQEFARQLAGTEFVVLDDVAYVDSAGKIRSWKDWDPKATSRLYVNPQYVILFNPMTADPKKASSIKSTKTK